MSSADPDPGPVPDSVAAGDANAAPEVPFSEPWQAQVFALTVHLNQQRLFSWAEWAATFGAVLQKPDAAGDGSDYYDRWAIALEQLLTDKGLTTVTALDNTAAAWSRAAEATPHGHPIELRNDPMGQAR